MSAQAARVLPQGAWLGLHLKRTGGPQASFTKRSIFNIPYPSSDGEQQIWGEGISDLITCEYVIAWVYPRFSAN